MKRRISIAMTLILMMAAGCSKPAPAPTEAPTQAVETEKSTEAPETEALVETQAPEAETEVPIPEDIFLFTRENFPRMDGSTSLAPLGEAVSSVLLGEDRDSVKDLVNFNKTTQSYRNLMDGKCDLLLASEPNAVVFDEMKQQNFEIAMEAISTEALVFVVNENNPVDSLTTEQIQDIYSGKITNWKEVGGEDLEIQAFQRNSGSGSQALMAKLVMGDIPMADAPEDKMISGMGELMEAVRNFDNSADAIGYSVYYYANDMRMADGLKIIAVNDVEPSDDTIRSGEYPHTNAYFCAINAAEPEDSPARILYNWLATQDGQNLVAAEGYVSVLAPQE